MVLTVDLGRDPDMRAALTDSLVPKAAKRSQQDGAADIARQSHVTSSSSRTKCRRMIPGRSIVSSK